jgi:hypothetical protein
MKLVALLAVALAQAAPAGAGPLVLRAEQDVGGSLSQQAVVFGEDDVTVTRNSNFLCEPGANARLGVFKARHYDERFESLRRQAEQVAGRLKPKPGESGVAQHESPHRLRLYVGKAEVTGERPAEGTVTRIIEDSCADNELRAEHAVQLTLRAENGRELLQTKTLGGKNAGRTTTVAASKACQKREGGVWECSIRGYGKAFLKL